MTLCPVAVVAGCEKCPVVKLCPLKSVIGNYPEPPPPAEKTKTKTKK